ncbi:DUF6197 family protein [Sphingomonas sp. TX0522]|uniref:DUF6197 family protein n=1 Tax=Sphingomonas sp. TX0522 TaxID=2479205 RepID=UPI0018DFF2AC|nr:hypothetical protein [Sphingomonas sp. TX0522]MBI0530887.1 hypothetical protein [Sphingomonas sp. TX0522]
MTPRTPITGEEVADVLERAADLIAKPGAWTQGNYARDAAGEGLHDGFNPAAVCWCAYGAIEKVTNEGMGGDLRNAAANAIPWGPFWNDAPERTQAKVVAALRSAATAARQQGEVA